MNSRENGKLLLPILNFMFSQPPYCIQVSFIDTSLSRCCFTHVPFNLPFPVFVHGAGDSDAQTPEENIIRLWTCVRLVDLILQLDACTDFEKLVAIAELVTTCIRRQGSIAIAQRQQPCGLTR